MTQPLDPDFAARVAQYEANHKKGIAFQANGTLGGTPAKAERRPWRTSMLRRTIKTLLIVLGLKVGLYHVAAMSGYNATSTIVMDSSGIIAKATSLVLYPDAVSQEVSAYLRIGQQYLANSIRQAMF